MASTGPARLVSGPVSWPGHDDVGVGDGAGSGARLSELLAAISLGTDLGMGHQKEHVLRQRFIALAAAERIGFRAAKREVVRRSSLLVWVGRHVDALEQAKWFGEDLVLKHDIRWVDDETVSEAAGFLLRMGAEPHGVR